MNTSSGVICTDSSSEESVTKFMFPEKAVAKRKSSIFTRRSSVAYLDKKDSSYGPPIDDTADKSQMELEAYVEILKNEISDWKIMYQQTRNIRKSAAKQHRTRSIANEDLLGVLTEEDNKFLAEKSDYCRTRRDAMCGLERLQISVSAAKAAEMSILLLIEHVELAESVMNKRIIEQSHIQ